MEIEKLKFQIAKLRRMQFGRSSERIAREIAQLELRLEELETGEAEDAVKAEAISGLSFSGNGRSPNGSRSPIICPGRRSCTSLRMTVPVPAPTAGPAWRGSAWT
ncbi:MAG: transposase [Pseudomonadota bacterium]